MLCPEVWNFPPPKVFSSIKNIENLENVEKVLKLNNFYKSVILTCPDELHIPKQIEEVIIEDSDYYMLSNCSITEFLDPVFIKSFVKSGKINCLSADRNCVTQNCASITPDGILTLHILEYIHQTLGLEGTKSSHGFIETKIDLMTHDLSNNKLRKALDKLETLDFYITWEPDVESICPSSIAKYFIDKNICVSCHSLKIKSLSPTISQVPSLIDTEIDEVVEWIGMLAHNCDLTPTEGYISSYKEPECTSPIKSNRISLLIVEGFLTSFNLTHLLHNLSEYVKSRDIDNYWACMSVQSIEDSLWRWNVSSLSTFQSHNSSCNIFITSEKLFVYSIGQLNYS